MAGRTPEGGPNDLKGSGFLRLLAADPAVLSRLEAGVALSAETPFHYPGRRGPVVLRLTPGPDDSGSDRPRAVRISDGGDLLKSMDEQGMDLAVDMILSKTVFHAVKEVERAGLAGGQVFVESDTERVSADAWRLVQLLIEVIGLRHSKYKDALVRLSRRQEGPELIDWNER